MNINISILILIILYLLAPNQLHDIIYNILKSVIYLKIFIFLIYIINKKLSKSIKNYIIYLLNKL